MQSDHIQDEKNPLKGIMICVLAYFFTALIGVGKKSLSPAVSIPQVLLFQSFFCLVLLLPVISKRGLAHLKTREYSNYFIRIVSGLACYVILYYLIGMIPVSEALLYQYSASLWLPLILMLWLKVKMPSKQWPGILVGFLGIAFILRPGESFFGLISLLGMLCAILQAFSVIGIRLLSLTEPGSRMLFYNFLVSFLLTLPFAIYYWVPLTLLDTAILLGMGLSTYLAQKYFTLSVQYANTTTLAPICYTAILFSGLIGWFLWNEVPQELELLGMGLVVLGCLLSVYSSRSKTILR